MDEKDFEGTLVLEKLAEIQILEAFYEAIDCDNFSLARKLMQKAGVDLQSIQLVMKKMAEYSGDPSIE